LLSSDGGGGVIVSEAPLDVALLAGAAREHGARFGQLDRPDSKSALLHSVRAALALPRYTGSNWDALEEVLAYPERSNAGPLVVAWVDPQGLPAGDAATFLDIVQRAADARASAGDGPLVVVAGPGAPRARTRAPGN
jgi:hypothetical protein